MKVLLSMAGVVALAGTVTAVIKLVRKRHA